MSAITWAANECHWSCRFSVCHVPPQCTTHAASLTCHLPSYHVEEFISAFAHFLFRKKIRITWNSLCKMALIWGGTCRSFFFSSFFSIKQISLNSSKSVTMKCFCCDFFFLRGFFFTWVSYFRNSSFSHQPTYRSVTTCTKGHFSYSQEAYMFTCTHIRLSILTTVSESNNLLRLWGQKQPFTVCQKTALWPFEVLTESCCLCVEEEFRILGDMDIITTTPAHLTASYLNCAKRIGFTVQMYMCMGVFFLAVLNVLVSAGMCVSEAIYWELPLCCLVWLDCSSHLVYLLLP